MIHRDLKPANIMVDQAGRVRLADLGISAFLDDPYTELLGMRDTRGTVTFMSPQQHEGEPPQVSDDIYALGLLFMNFVWCASIPYGRYSASVAGCASPTHRGPIKRKATSL